LIEGQGFNFLWKGIFKDINLRRRRYLPLYKWDIWTYNTG